MHIAEKDTKKEEIRVSRIIADILMRLDWQSGLYLVICVLFYIFINLRTVLCGHFVDKPAKVYMGEQLARAACVRCHETKCPLLMAFFSLLLTEVVTFLPEGVNVGFNNFAWGFRSQRK